MQQIPQSTTTAAYRRVYFTLVDETDLQDRLTGITSGLVIIKISKNGGEAETATNSIVEVDADEQPGVYYVELTASECDTLGLLTITIRNTVA